MVKRIIALLLLVTLTLSLMLLSSCNSGDESSAPETSGSSDGFLLEPKQWGKTITILTHDIRLYSTCEIATEETTGEPVNDAFYNRNAFIEQNYGLSIVAETMSDQNEMVEAVRRNCQSTLDEFQAVNCSLFYISALGVEGFLYDYNSIGNNYIQTDKEWWDQSAVRDLTIDGSLWFLNGDIVVSDDEATWGLFFNKDLVATHNLPNPFELVRAGKWTLDEMNAMLQEVHLMHGTTMSYDPEVKDQWGLVMNTLDCYSFMLGAGQPMVDVDGTDIQVRLGSEENVNTFSKVFEILTDPDHVGVADMFGKWDSGVYSDQSTIFANGNALFMPANISLVSEPKIREAEIHYGILPMPKKSELQDEYTTTANSYWCPVISIPLSNVTNLDATCYALEAMAYYGKKMVTPEYYERTLTLKRFTDQDSVDMLDLIFRNRTYDLGAIFNFADGAGSGMLYFYTTLLMSKSNTISSNYEARAEAYQASIEELLDTIKESKK